MSRSCLWRFWDGPKFGQGRKLVKKICFWKFSGPRVENLSWLQESIFSLYTRPQLQFRKTNQKRYRFLLQNYVGNRMNGTLTSAFSSQDAPPVQQPAITEAWAVHLQTELSARGGPKQKIHCRPPGTTWAMGIIKCIEKEVFLMNSEGGGSNRMD